MNSTTEFRDAVLLALDPRFAELGFRRRKADQEWRRKVSTEIAHSFHINFGLYPRSGELLLNPSVGVRHDSIERKLVDASLIDPRSSKGRTTVGAMLSTLSGRTYAFSMDDTPVAAVTDIWTDWLAHGVPWCEELSRSERVVERLMSDDPARWGAINRSFRARLLPLALEAEGRRHEAITWMHRLRDDLGAADQLVPKIEHFSAWYLQNHLA